MRLADAITALMPRTSLPLVLPATLLVFVGLVVPVGYLLLLSFNPSRIGTIELTSQFTFANYVRLLGDAYYWSILGRTVWIASVTTALACALGFVLAVALWQSSPRWKGTLTVIILAPLLVSIVARVFGWIIILGDKGLLNRLLLSIGLEPVQLMYTDFAVVMGLVHVLLPYAVLTILASLDKLDPNLPEAAKTLGAGGFTVLREVLFPLALPGIVAAGTIVFSLAMSSYVTPALMGSPKSKVVTTVVYQQFVVVFNWHFGAVLVAILLATSLMMILLTLGAVSRLRAAQ